MNNSQDNIESKIKQAAAQEPPFNEAAWKKMEELLDQEGRKKPFAWWWLTMLLIGAGLVSYLFITNNNQSDNASSPKIAQLGQSKHGHKPAEIISTQSLDQKTNAPIPDLNNEVSSINQPGQGSKNAVSLATKVKQNNAASRSAAPLQASVLHQVKSEISPGRSTKRFKSRKHNVAVANNSQQEDAHQHRKQKRMLETEGAQRAIIVEGSAESSLEQGTGGLQKNQISAEVETPTATTLVTDSMLKKLPDSTSVLAKATNNKAAGDSAVASNEKQAKSRRVFFGLMAGLGADPVKAFNYGKENPFTFKYGMLAGIHINNCLSVSAGFNVHQKKYSADSNSYKLKSLPPHYQLTGLDADCKVYEIPVVFNLSVFQRNKSTYILSAGFVSFIMKSEEYYYHYMYYGNPRYASYHYTRNSHYFASMLLGAAWQHILNNKFALQVAPAFSIPLQGIGDGKVKLYSGQLMAGLIYNPGKR